MQGKTRDELLQLVEERENWTKKEVKNFLATMKLKNTNSPESIKVGDVYYVGTLQHPAIVIKKTKDVNLALIISTKDGDNVLCPCQSRFYPNSFFTVSLQLVSDEQVKENFLGVYDNSTHLIEVKKLFKNLVFKL